jgi:hypothetical protein
MTPSSVSRTMFLLVSVVYQQARVGRFVEEVRGVGHIEDAISSDANLHLQRITCNDCRGRVIRSDRTIPTSVNV